MYYHHALLDPLLERPEATVFIRADGSKLKGEQVLASSKTLAHHLYQQGFREHDVVVLTLPAGESFLYIMYAMIILRAKVAIIDPEMGRANFTAKLKQLQPKWAFVDSRILLLNEHPILRAIIFKWNKHIPYFHTPGGCRVISVGSFMPTVKRHQTLKSLLRDAGSDIVLTRSDQPHEFLIVYTSGTIQEPKGVVHTFDSLIRSIHHLTEIIGCERGDLIGTDLPQYMLLGISAGIPVVLAPSKMSTAKRLRWIEEQGITILFSPPSEMLAMVAKCEKDQVKFPLSVRRILLGSAPVHRSFLKRLHAVTSERVQISSLYGMTELLICALIDSRVKINYKTEGDVLGIPWKDVQCRVAEDGEILLSSPQLYARYFHEKDRPEFHATGDTGYVDEHGYLILTGRKKDMIIRKNFNIYPGIYEAIIRQVEGVDDCAMVGLWNEQKEDEEVYLVVEGDTLTSKKINHAISQGIYAIDRQALPDYVIIRKLPRGGRQNKINKKELRRMLAAEFNIAVRTLR